MKQQEKLLLEAIKNMLSDNVKLGLVFHPIHAKYEEPADHKTQFHIQHVEDMMRIKLNNPKIRLYEAISGAFFHTHSYKNIDDPQFDLAFRKQMSGMVVPIVEQDLAVQYLNEIREELGMNIYGRETRLAPPRPNTSSAEQYTGLADLDGIRQSMGTAQ